MSLSEVMNGLNADVLKALAKRLDLPKTLTRKADLIGAVEQHVNTHLDAFVAELSERDRLFLAEAAHHGGRMSPHVFEAKHQVRTPRTSRWLGAREASLIHLLLDEDESSGEVKIPEDLAERLRPLLPKPPEPAVKTIDGIPTVLDLGAQRHYVGEKQRSVHLRAHAWAVLVQQCGWAKPHGSQLVLTKAGKDLLGGVSPVAFREGFDRLVGDDQFDEINRINHIRGQSGKAKRHMTHPSERRGAICESMTYWPIQRWVPFGEAFRFIAATGNPFHVTGATIWMYFGELQYGHLGDIGDELERQYLRAFLMEPLATLGVADVAYVSPQGLWPELSGRWGTDDMEFCGRYDGLLYVRLTPLGAYCLGTSETYEPPASEKRSLLKVLPNRELAISGGAELASSDRCTLELFAKQEGDHLWSLDPQRILDYVESGGSVEDVSRFLEQNTSEEIPHTVEVFLGDLTGKLGAVRGLEKAILVEMRDAEVAARVAHDRQTKSLCRPAGDRYLAVPEKNEQAFRTALKRLGYVLPR